MIKLEELKNGDKVFAVCYDKDYRYIGKYADTEVVKELCTIDFIPPIEGVICTGGIEILDKSYEKYLFKTEKERDEEVIKFRQNIINNFMNDDFLKKKIFEKATTIGRLDKYYRELFKDILSIE